ncbi:DUF1772 domain-containing protein [Demequina sp. NBRC 110053]|uniref:anthrone oxygenase family protein n=1 Tax=Demequina sp. NBRC 110053 TaxID=1570342 RepID=UPI00190EFF13|nr:anthrone oxygenase family protein [Demequina sp. NBRC 110053]
MSVYEAVVAAAAVISGLAGGVLYAFSAFVMAGIREQPDAAAAATMQAINRHALRAPLGILILLTITVPLAAAVMAIAGDEPRGAWAIAGAAVVLVAGIGVTAVGNIPLNERLARATDPAASWRAFVTPWLRWNHVRAAAGAVGACLFTLAL